MWFTEIGGKYEDLVPNIVDDLNNNKIKFADVPELKQALDQLNDMAQKGYFGEQLTCLTSTQIFLCILEQASTQWLLRNPVRFRQSQQLPRHLHRGRLWYVQDSAS